MTPFELIMLILVFLVAAWLVRYIPVTAQIQNVIIGVIAVVILIYILSAIGLFGPLNTPIHLGHRS